MVTLVVWESLLLIEKDFRLYYCILVKDLRLYLSDALVTSFRDATITILTTALSLAASWAALGICYNSGQDCTAGSRVYVQETIYDKFLDLLVQKVKAQTIGDGFDEQTGGGPVVRAAFYSTDPKMLYSFKALCLDL